MNLLILTLLTASIVLIITKSKILGAKREFVHERYLAAKESAKIDGSKVGWIHVVWHAWWTCSMCLGYWVAAVVCYIYPTEYGWLATTLVVGFLNWLIHCVENILFQIGYFFETHVDKELIDDLKKYLKKKWKLEDKEV